jgi:hypothetical protein
VKSCISAIDDGSAQRFDSAILRACIALDATSKAHFGAPKSAKTHFKDLIREYYWLLHMMQGGGVDFKKTRFNNLKIENNGKEIENPDFADVLYHAYRCKLVHDGDYQSGVDVTVSSAELANWVFAENMLYIPSRVLWGLVAICVFAKCNAGLNSQGDHHLTWTANSFGMPTFVFLLRDCWGAEDKIRTILLQYPLAPLIEMRWTEKTCTTKSHPAQDGET